MTPIISQPAHPPICDLITPGDGPNVFSMFRLVQGYTGYCRRVQRSSDSATLDVGFTAGGLYNIKKELDWAAGANTYVIRWYNQNPANTFAIPYLESTGTERIDASSGGTPITFQGYPAFKMRDITSELSETTFPLFFEESIVMIWIGQLGTPTGGDGVFSINADGPTAGVTYNDDVYLYDKGPYDWNYIGVPGIKYGHPEGVGGWSTPTVMVNTYLMDNASTDPLVQMGIVVNNTSPTTTHINEELPDDIAYNYDGPVYLNGGTDAIHHTLIYSSGLPVSSASVLNNANWVY